MTSSKVHILYTFTDKAWGGGNQFLKNLKRFLEQCNAYTDNPEKADIILLNSHQQWQRALSFKKKYPRISFVHRIAGPIRFYRTDGWLLDTAIYTLNNLIVDGTLFQSHYTQSASLQTGMQLRDQKNVIIINAPDPKLFYAKPIAPLADKKIKLIATSWSGGAHKGFDIYTWLDQNLDFSKYEMTFVGNTPVSFSNITHKAPMNSEELANELRTADIFISASKIESCSNSLLEALHCGLPAIAYNSTSMPEVVGNAGELFSDPTEIPALLTQIEENYVEYRNAMQLPTMDEIGAAYLAFCRDVHDTGKTKSIGGMMYVCSFIFLFSIDILRRIYAKLQGDKR